ncbi:MAG: hypothetical protein ACYTF9_02025 [Planctomycetota bacterium]|jgi:uncharacterized membrane protein
MKFTTSALSLALAIGIPAFAQDATFQVLDQAFYCMDVTPDGQTVVGTTNSFEAYSWTAKSGYTFFGGEEFVAVNDDATVFFGTEVGGSGSTAATWTAADQWQSIGFLPNALNCPSKSSPYDLSADGSIAVGLSWDGCSGRGFWWSEATGMLELEVLGNGGNRASACSADGSVIVGFAQGTFNRTPAVWYDDLSGMLLDPTGDTVGEVYGVSDDGSVLVGTWAGEAFRWTEECGLEILGSLLSGSWIGNAIDIADDGTIVGFDSLQTSLVGWIIPPGGVITRLDDYLEANGAGSVPSLQAVTAISSDGTTIVGHNFFDNGWVATIPPAGAGPTCSGDVDGSGVVDVSDLVTVILEWGACAGSPCNGPCLGDTNGDFIVDVQDLVEVVLQWGDCP